MDGLQQRCSSVSAKGFTLLEVMVATALLSVTALAFVGFQLQIVKQITEASTLSEVDIFRRNIRSLLTQDESWNQTVAQNAEIQGCINSGVCASFVGLPNAQKFNLFDAAGNLVYNSRVSENGITLDGRPCGPSAPAPFNSAQYSFNPDTLTHCPLRYELKWYVLSAGTSPKVAVIAQLKVSRGLKMAIEANRYSIGACEVGFNVSGSYQCTKFRNYLVKAKL